MKAREPSWLGPSTDAVASTVQHIASITLTPLDIRRVRRMRAALVVNEVGWYAGLVTVVAFVVEILLVAGSSSLRGAEWVADSAVWLTFVWFLGVVVWLICWWLTASSYAVMAVREAYRLDRACERFQTLQTGRRQLGVINGSGSMARRLFRVMANRYFSFTTRPDVADRAAVVATRLVRGRFAQVI